MKTCENITVARLDDPSLLRICITTEGQDLSFEITRDMGFLFLYELYASVDLYGDTSQLKTIN